VPATLQTKATFDASSTVAWPEYGACDPPLPSLPESDPAPTTSHAVQLRLLIDVTSFDRDAFKESLSRQLTGVTISDISLTYGPTAPSVRVGIVIGTRSASEANTVVAELIALTANTASASTALGVNIELVEMTPEVVMLLGPAEQGKSGEVGTGLIVGIAVGGLAVLLLTGYLWLRRRGAASSFPVGASSKTKDVQNSAQPAKERMERDLEIQVDPVPPTKTFCKN